MTRVMIVDDESLVLGTLRRMLALRLRDADIRTSHQPLAARQELLREPVDILVTDRNMPGISGEELIRDVKRASPDTVCVLLTGDEAKTPWFSPTGCFACLGKPVNLAVLGETVRQAMEVSTAAKDPGTRKVLDMLAKAMPPAAGELPHDGRGSGRRWLEACGATVGLGGAGLNSSASVLKIMSSDFLPALAVVTGFVEQLSMVADRPVIERHWREMLALAGVARRTVASAGADESEQLTVQLREFSTGIGAMLGELSGAAPDKIGLALFARLGFTQAVFGCPVPLRG
ncbi:response regulator [Zavarzinella formosa]|uniref:response regulator n=1 Tax=Zavarzinella formosa TaxID=360055 RepID=UPI0003135F74|nr:response regulator [Zavarzinella formosa]